MKTLLSGMTAAVIVAALVGGKTLGTGGKNVSPGIDRLVAGELDTADTPIGHICGRHDAESDIWRPALLDGRRILKDVTERRFVGLGIGNVDRATVYYVKATCVQNPIIDEKWWLSVPTVEGLASPQGEGARWGNYGLAPHWLQANAGRVFGNSNVGHSGILLIKSIYRGVLDFERNIRSGFASRIDERDGEVDSLVGLHLLNKRCAERGEPSPLRGFQRISSRDDAPDAYNGQYDRSDGIRDVRWRNISFYAAALATALGWCLILLAFVCHAPIFGSVLPRAYQRWAVCLISLIAGSALLLNGFDWLP
jgi:hypothetical protein